MRKPVLVLLFVLVTSACSGSSAGTGGGTEAPVGGLRSALQDDVRKLPGKEIAWSTYWTLCWDAYPGAVAYQVSAVTSKRSSTHVQRQRGRCVRLEAAAGRNPASKGLSGRDVLLDLQAAQLAYRIRAVLSGSRYSRWSAPAPVGERVGG
ncbi:MAG: hypothetical protein H0V60_06920 [Actinobacteria bacterium]|jgi:hypothetical protein|nr:hypothetical protein [Actinomycetota bacterium]